MNAGPAFRSPSYDREAERCLFRYLVKVAAVAGQRVVLGRFEGPAGGYFSASRKEIGVDVRIPWRLRPEVLAHELGHCFLHAGLVDVARYHCGEEYWQREEEADQFAAAFLALLPFALVEAKAGRAGARGGSRP